MPKRPVRFCSILLAALIALMGGAARAATSHNFAPAAFRKLAALAGNWAGKDNMGAPVRSHFELIANETAVMETFDMSPTEEMVTIYSVDGKSIALMHYCPVGNQPRMRATPSSADAKTLDFHFTGAGNLPSLAMGHEQRLVLQFIDANHIVEHWTWRKNGKDTAMIYHLTRQ